MLTKDQGRRGLRPYREESNIGRWVCVEVPEIGRAHV